MKIYVFHLVSIFLRIYLIYLVNSQERSLSKSSISVLWQKENFILPFAVNGILNLSILAMVNA